jgi:hypothetical protein
MVRIARVLSVVAIVGCAVSPPPLRANVAVAVPVTVVDEAPRVTRTDQVVLVAIDGARWQDIFAKVPVMPTLRRFMTTDGISVGAPGYGEMRATGPNYVSLPGYTEIFTGRTSKCKSNDCPPIDERTIVDEVIDSGGEAAVISSWEMIDRAAAREPARAVLSTGRKRVAHGDELDHKTFDEGAHAGPGCGIGEYRQDAHTIKLALEYLSHHTPKFAFVGLGDSDEHAHRDNRTGYVDALRTADAFLAQLEERVSEHAAILVTADHGRAANFKDHGMMPEAARVWLVARGAGIDARGPLEASPVRLADIAPTIRCLLGLSRVVASDAGETIPQICSY